MPVLANMVQQRGGPVLINAVCMPQITEISMGGTAQMSCLRQALGSLQQSCVMFRKIKLLNKIFVVEDTEPYCIFRWLEAVSQGQHPAEGEAGESLQQQQPGQPCSRRLPGSQHPRATHHQRGLRRGTCSHMLAKHGVCFLLTQGWIWSSFQLPGT